MLAALALLCPGRGLAEPLAFSLHGESVAELSVEELEARSPRRELRVFEPHEQREVAFSAVDFARLLDAVYGEAWRRGEELLFTCRDGYQPTVPVSRFLEHRAWLATARVGSPDFGIAKWESGAVRRVALGPFYLIWDNLDDALIRQEGDYGWPYQLVGVDVIRTRERFPRSLPPAGSSPAVRAGFRAYRAHCSRCHALHGEGGQVGPALLPERLAQLDRDWLRRWIDDPSQLVPNARMERLNPSLPDRERVIEEILDYLEAMEPTSGAE